MTTMRYDVIVVGKGMMGSAAAKYLAQGGARVALIGPDEPADAATHDGVFASHYDQGRITRQLAQNRVWAELARRAISAYSAITAASGIDFHVPTGGVYAAPAGSDTSYLTLIAEVAAQQQVAYEPLTAAQVTARFPYLALPDGYHAIWEGPPAGYINPRALVQAQVAVAQQHDTAVIRDIAVRIDLNSTGITVMTRSGAAYQADKVLVATGAYAGSNDLLPRPLQMRVKTEFIVLGELPPAEVERLAGMPTVIDVGTYGPVHDIYLLPPILYPDGKVYLKLGANTAADRTLADLAAIQAWMTRGDGDVMLAPLREAVTRLVPDVQAVSWHTRRCLITYTPHGYPMIDTLLPGRLYLCAGGNGTSAKSSDAMGHLAARLVAAGRWEDDLDPHLFTAVFRHTTR